jgi:malic enzyme
MCTGSPFDPVTLGGKTFRIGQGNNAFIFPGVGLGVMVAGIRRVTDGMFYEAARALKKVVHPEDLAEGSIFPRLTRIREASHAVACAVIHRAVTEGHADVTILDDLEARVTAAMWNPDYLPIRYEP